MYENLKKMCKLMRPLQLKKKNTKLCILFLFQLSFSVESVGEFLV